MEIWLGAGHFPVAGLVPVAGRDCEKCEDLRDCRTIENDY